MNFDLAFCFKKDSQEVTQAFNFPHKQFAPEIESGQPHGSPADVWGLANLAKQLVALTSTDSQKTSSNHPLTSTE